jgi:hypothetical protein
MARPIRSITLGLAWRLFLAQAFTVLFAVVALILTWGDKDSWGMDMFMAEAVAKAVHSEGGRLVLDQARWDKLDANAGAISGSRRSTTRASGWSAARFRRSTRRCSRGCRPWVPPNWVRWCRPTWTWRG